MTPIQETVAAAILSCVIAAAGFAAGYKRAQNTYVPKLDATEQELSKARAEVASLSASISSQNAAIAQVKAQAEQRAKEAQSAITKAAEASAQAQIAAQRILASRPPTGADECKAAQAAFDAELRQERGVK